MDWNDLFYNTKPPDHDYDDAAMGPILRPDAALLAAVCQYIQPRTVIEYGSHEGHSAAILCRFTEKLYCVEIDNPRCGFCHVIDRNPNITHIHASMCDWTPPEEERGKIDLVYMDASHDHEDSLKAYWQYLPFLSGTALIICHDTGTWNGTYPNENWRTYEGRAPAVAGERAFVDDLQSLRGWNAVSFGGERVFRHGLTILQYSAGWEDTK